MSSLLVLVWCDELIGILLILSEILDLLLINLAGLLLTLLNIVVFLFPSFVEGTVMTIFLWLIGLFGVLVTLFIPEEGISLSFVTISGIAEFGKMLNWSEIDEGLYDPGDSGDHMMLNNNVKDK